MKTLKPCHTSLQAEPFLAPFYYSAYTISQKDEENRWRKVDTYRISLDLLVGWEGGSLYSLPS